MAKRYKIKKTPKLIKQLKPFWAKFEILQTQFHNNIFALEGHMAKVTGIKDIEFFHSDTGWCGIGNVSRTMPLVHDQELI